MSDMNAQSREWRPRRGLILLDRIVDLPRVEIGIRQRYPGPEMVGIGRECSPQGFALCLPVAATFVTAGNEQVELRCQSSQSDSIGTQGIEHRDSVVPLPLLHQDT